MSVERSATEPFESCSYCNGWFKRGVRYPVTVREGDGRELQIHSFCDSNCQDAWEAEN